jgi:RimJ/RimL family protein N-acetyltransferase
MYVLELPAPLGAVAARHPTGGALRNPRPEDTELLAEVMLDAYRNTIDYEGETTDDALNEMEKYFAGAWGPPLPDCSWVYEASGTLLAASLVTLWDEEPFVAFIMTRAAWKGRGLASYVLRQSLLSVQDCGYREVRAVITEGNTPSERAFARFGFAHM